MSCTAMCIYLSPLLQPWLLDRSHWWAPSDGHGCRVTFSSPRPPVRQPPDVGQRRGVRRRAANDGPLPRVACRAQPDLRDRRGAAPPVRGVPPERGVHRGHQTGAGSSRTSSARTSSPTSRATSSWPRTPCRPGRCSRPARPWRGCSSTPHALAPAWSRKAAPAAATAATPATPSARSPTASTGGPVAP